MVGERTAAGVLHGVGVIEVARLLRRAPLSDVRALLEAGPDVLKALASACRAPDPALMVALPEHGLRAPILQPPTIRDFMVYEGHANQGGSWQLSEAWYRLPAFYFSNPLCIYGPGALVPLPSTTRKFDFELEIAAVIGQPGANVDAADALAHVAGFTIFNDWSSRDLQRDEMAVNLGPAKGKDSASSLGPAVVTLDELASSLRGGQLELSCALRVNGVEWVSGTTAGMHHDWPALIERASRDSRIVPGDVIGGGTIVGGTIGEAMRLGRPARYLQAGDVVEIEVEHLGVLRNIVGTPVPLPAAYRFLPPSKSTRA